MAIDDHRICDHESTFAIPWIWIILAAETYCQHFEKDILGHDMKTVRGQLPTACYGLCKAEPGCKAYSFSNGVCYLKDVEGPLTPNRYVNSGVMRPCPSDNGGACAKTCEDGWTRFTPTNSCYKVYYTSRKSGYRRSFNSKKEKRKIKKFSATFIIF